MATCNADVYIDVGFVAKCDRYGEVEERLRPVKYNVSSFLRDYDDMGKEWHSKLEKYIQTLDEHVRIDINAEIHKPIVDGIDFMVNNICEELNNKEYPVEKVLKSGSLYAGLRVGLPYEADVLLQVKHYEAFRDSFEWVEQYSKAICDIAGNLALENWSVYDTTTHRVGACLNLVYKDKTGGRGNVGVLVDLIPCMPLPNEQIQMSELNDNAQQYVSSKLVAADFHKYAVPHFLKAFSFDTGYLEHQILKHLPEKIRGGHRIAKYLLQSYFVHSFPPVFPKLEGKRILSKEESTRLFGYKTIVPSHILQVYLLQLLIAVHGTALEDQLTGSKLTLCLLDMLYYCAQELLEQCIPYINEDEDYPVKNQIALVVQDAVIRDRIENYQLTVQGPGTGVWNLCLLQNLRWLSCTLMTHASAPDVSVKYHYLISHFKKQVRFMPRMYHVIENFFISEQPKVCQLKFEGFCRGPSPEEMINCHNCVEQECERVDMTSCSEDQQRCYKDGKPQKLKKHSCAVS